MKRIGITGQQGFVGTHLWDTVSLLKDEFTPVPFEKQWFGSKEKLAQWVQQCDVIVHLAAMNRHEDPQFIHDTNVELVQKLVDAFEATGLHPHVLFSSSIQEEMDNLYGASKKKGRALFSAWAKKHSASFTGLVIPNVFGPFCKPFYNSVVATFCHQLCNGQQLKIDKDSEVKLIYINELVSFIFASIRNIPDSELVRVGHTSSCKVSELLSILTGYKNDYLDNGIFPPLRDPFSVNLFNTFRSYIDHKSHFPVTFKKNSDDRGVFVELARINMAGQVSFSTTHPGIVRGNHFHTRKIERFMVIKGKAQIQLRRYNTKEVINFELDGNEPSYVDMPVWYLHNIKNTGNEELYTVFWINEFYDPADPDTYFEKV
jgi:UDP-2-acetamido-2,6-beta-L-arabino-hexul-4-ose reductase